MKKMTLKDLQALFPERPPSIPGDPNKLTKATNKNHVHVHNLSKGERAHTAYLAKKEATNGRTRKESDLPNMPSNINESM